MYSLVRKFIFSMQPESAHEFTIKALKMAGKLPFPIFPTPDNPVEVMGLKFKNPIGLAAGAGSTVLASGPLAFSFCTDLTRFADCPLFFSFNFLEFWKANSMAVK